LVICQAFDLEMFYYLNFELTLIAQKNRTYGSCL